MGEAFGSVTEMTSSLSGVAVSRVDDQVPKTVWQPEWLPHGGRDPTLAPKEIDLPSRHQMSPGAFGRILAVSLPWNGQTHARDSAEFGLV